MALKLQNSVTIYQGEDKDIVITICERLEDGSRGDPVDLDSASEIKVLFPLQAGGALQKTKTAGQITPLNAPAGKFSVRLTAADTLLLAVGDSIGIEVRYTIQSFLTIVSMPGAITVQASLFPSVVN